MSDENIKNDSLSGEGEVVEYEESFAALLGKSSNLSVRLEPGQRVTSRAISISEDTVYVDLGGKSEGMIDLSEFVDKTGKLHVKEGDEIEAFFLSVQDGMRKLTTLIRGYSSVQLKAIRDTRETGLAINGKVKREVKGGFEISLGGVRCFCPLSQIDLKGGREGGIYLGQTFPFKVLEYEDDGRNIIVSRRTLLEEEKQARIDKLKETVVVGTEVTAKISSVQNFGAFIDLGGIDGLIPACEISWARTENLQMSCLLARR